jgi:hypothetical protein
MDKLFRKRDNAMQSGGGPFQIYCLQNGVSVGKSVAITLVRTLQVIFSFVDNPVFDILGGGFH